MIRGKYAVVTGRVHCGARHQRSQAGHAGVADEAYQRGKLGRLCRYIARPAVAIERLSLTAQGRIRRCGRDIHAQAVGDSKLPPPVTC
jgi:hypothetical protein